jgi:hypothetical protein
MSVSRWLRENAEHYLLVDAQNRVAIRHGAGRPRKPHGAEEFFWLRVFAPAYRAVPWRLRIRVLRAMPGSHRRTWSAWTDPPTARKPAV